MAEVSFNEIIISFLITWLVGLLPPLMIRFLIFRRPLKKWVSALLCVFFYFGNVTFFIALGSQNKTHTVLVIVAVISYFILIKKSPSRQAGKHTSEKARQVSEHVASPITDHEMEDTTAARIKRGIIAAVFLSFTFCISVALFNYNEAQSNDEWLQKHPPGPKWSECEQSLKDHEKKYGEKQRLDDNITCGHAAFLQEAWDRALNDRAEARASFSLFWKLSVGIPVALVFAYLLFGWVWHGRLNFKSKANDQQREL